MSNETAFAGKHSIVPLPLDPTRLRGLSERLIRQHHESNYGGAVKNLNRAEEELTRTTKDTPPFVVAALKERELMFRNSAILHEHYFANLGGDGKPSGAIEKALNRAYGSCARWEEHFRQACMGLAGGSGWAVLYYDFRKGDIASYGFGHHTQSLAFGQPLLVMDMYEHSYHVDYGAAAAKYVEAFFQNIDFEEVNRRFERAESASATLHPRN